MEFKDFYIGQRVKIYDKEDACNVYGHVTKLNPDNPSVFVRWNDLSDDVEHHTDEFNDIKPGTPNH